MFESPRKILVAEDEEANREALKDLLESQNFLVDIASNGQEAIGLLKTNRYLLVITDLRMPIVDGEELVRYILTLEDPPLILVQTVVTDMNLVVDLMRQAVYDYIPKPYTNQEFLHRVRLAYEMAELRRLNARVEKERQERIKAQLEWNLWKEKSLKQQGDAEDSTLIESLRTSLSQASGIGSLVSLVQILKSKAKPEGDHYIVSKKLMEMVFENGDIARKIIETLEELDYLLQAEIEYEEFCLNRFADLLETCIQEVSREASVRNHIVRFAKGKALDLPKKVRIHPGYFQRVFRELLLNAFKFSEPNTHVFVLLEANRDILKVSFLSDPKPNGRGFRGIPESMQSLIFEPFFRISKHVFEEYPTHDFGIGLTFVDKVVRKHKGKVTAYMVRSHLETGFEGEIRDLVNIEIELPYGN